MYNKTDKLLNSIFVAFDKNQPIDAKKHYFNKYRKKYFLMLKNMSDWCRFSFFLNMSVKKKINSKNSLLIKKCLAC